MMITHTKDIVERNEGIEWRRKLMKKKKYEEEKVSKREGK